MTKEEIAASDAKQVMEIALHYANPDEPYLDDWHEVYMIAESIYEELKKMVELGDIIDLIWVAGDKPIYIITEEGEKLELLASNIAK